MTICYTMHLKYILTTCPVATTETIRQDEQDSQRYRNWITRHTIAIAAQEDLLLLKIESATGSPAQLC